MLELVVDPDQRDLVQLRTLELSSDRPGFGSVRCLSGLKASVQT